MSKTIRTYIEQHVAEGMTLAQARNFTAQQIILSKISQSEYVDRVLIKGGVVMYNLTHENRRSTLDLDFDFVRYDISEESIKLFADILDRKEPNCRVVLVPPIQELHQQDYKGKRVNLLIKDETASLKLKVDIGVHTLLGISQNKMCFSFGFDEELQLFVNPPEQIFAEKLFSLAKIGPSSQRYKDIDDIYYLIVHEGLNVELVRKCLKLITIDNPYNIKDIQDVVDEAENCLCNKLFIVGYNENGGSWLGIEYEKAKNTIIDFIYKL